MPEQQGLYQVAHAILPVTSGEFIAHIHRLALSEGGGMPELTLTLTVSGGNTQEVAANLSRLLHAAVQVRIAGEAFQLQLWESE